jgi:hypothetical protein
MEKEKIIKILAQIADHENRLRQLEGGQRVSLVSTSNKTKTLREILKGVKFKNGQEQVASIVGYHEKILNNHILKDMIKDEWENAKMGVFSAMYISRAKDTLIRIHKDGTCDLTQSGEEFFDQFLKNESSNTTS